MVGRVTYFELRCPAEWVAGIDFTDALNGTHEGPAQS
jgi:hypothetical protein